MDKIVFDVYAKSSPKDKMRLWSMAPDTVDIPDTLAIAGTTETEEFLWNHGHGIKHLTLFLTQSSPTHIVHILPYCVGDTLETLDIRSTGFLDCYPIQFLSRLTTLSVNAMHVKRCTNLPTTLQHVRLCISSYIDIDVTPMTSMHTFSVAADKVTVTGVFSDTVHTVRVRGRSCTVPGTLPDSVRHLEVSGSMIDVFPDIPAGLKTLNIANTHIEPGQLDFSRLDLDECIAYGTYLEDDDIQHCRAKVLDIRWTSATHRVQFHPSVTTVYMDTIPSMVSSSIPRVHHLDIHIGQDPDHMSAACMVSMNNDMDRRDSIESPFKGRAMYTKTCIPQRIACHIWTQTMRVDDVDRLLTSS